MERVNIWDRSCADMIGKEGREVLPNPKAKALVSYLLSLRKDDAVPYSLNYSRDKKKAD